MEPTNYIETTPLFDLLQATLGLTPQNWEEAAIQLDAQDLLNQVLDLEQLLSVEADRIPVIEL